jgi:hypothetical protein
MVKQIFAVALSLLLLASCGKSNEAASQAVSDSVKAECADGKESVNGGFYKARIMDNGSVEVTFDQKQCEKLAEANSMPCRIGQNYQVEGLGKEKAVALCALNMGNDVSPYLAIVTDNGHVAILSIMDAVSTGDVTCSGPLEGYEDITSVQISSDEDGNLPYAVSSNGEKNLIEECLHSGYYVLDDFELHLTSDWNITMDSPSADFHKRGTFYINHMNDADGPGSFSRYIIANFSDGTSCFFYLNHDDENPDSYDIKFVDGVTPLVMNEDLRFQYSATSRLFD